jgi:hypothetical protein
VSQTPHTPQSPVLRHLSTPPAAALAGVLSAVLLGATIILIRTRMPEGLDNSTSWLNRGQGGIATAVALMPFAGITFLWFIAVVRDGFGSYEDKFFASVFLGSGLLFVAMMFVATAAGAALVASNRQIVDAGAHVEVVNFGKMIVLSASKTYAVRMAAVFMISLATIWLRTGLMPRWLVALSYLVALTVLVASDVSMWITLTFPVWMLVVSALLLIKNREIAEINRG